MVSLATGMLLHQGQYFIPAVAVGAVVEVDAKTVMVVVDEFVVEAIPGAATEVVDEAESVLRVVVPVVLVARVLGMGTMTTVVA